MIFKTLGSLVIEDEHGVAIKIPSSKPKQMLAYLWAKRDHAVERSELARIFWPDSDFEKAKGSVRQAIGELNKHVSPHLDPSQPLLLKMQNTVQFNVDASIEVDAEIFQTIISRAQSLHGYERASTLAQALEYYQGDFLASCYDDWVLPIQDELKSLFLSALQEMILQMAQMKEYRTAQAYAKRHQIAEPLSEEPHRQLMYLLYAMGDRNGAMRQFDECAQMLQREFESDPDEQTQLLHDKIHDRVSLQELNRLGLAIATGYATNLPNSISLFVGRQLELSTITDDLKKTRLLTLTGVGGCGKTRLALKVGWQQLEQFDDGVWIADLASITDPNLVAPLVAIQLGMPDATGSTAMELIGQALKSKEVLLILDNCEHVLDATAALCQAILKEALHVKILITSREALGIAGELAWPVSPMSLPASTENFSAEELREFDALTLFEDRARLRREAFAITEANSSVITQICQALDGIPLAIELAAARIDTLSVSQIASHLDDRFRLLRGSTRDTLSRQQTLEAAIDWSYDLLSPKEKLLFARLSIFESPFTLSAVERVCAADGIERADVLGLISQLLRKSLVFLSDNFEEDERYRLLETLIQYGRGRLRETDQLPFMRDQHLNYYLEISSDRCPPIESGPYLEWKKLFHAWMQKRHREYENFRAVLHWALDQQRAEDALLIAVSLRDYWYHDGLYAEGAQLTLAALKAYGGATSLLQVQALNSAASMEQMQGHFESAQALSEEALQLATENGQSIEILDALKRLGSIACQQNAVEQGVAKFKESLSIAEQHEDTRQIANIYNNLGVAESRRGDSEQAVRYFESTLALQHKMQDLSERAVTLANLGTAKADLGNAIEALALLRESLEVALEEGNRATTAFSKRTLGWFLYLEGELAEAKELLQDALQVHVEINEQPMILEALLGLAAISHHSGEMHDAAVLFFAADQLRQEIYTAEIESDQWAYEPLIQALRDDMGKPDFSKAWDQGRAMPFVEVIDLALGKES